MTNYLPIYDQASLSSLEERTQYENWLLEAVYAIAEQELFPDWPDGLIYHLDQKESTCHTFGCMGIVIGDWRPKFISAGAPLIFVTAFKLLDMMIEWVLERNSCAATFRFEEKIKLLHQGVVFPPFVENLPWLKERLSGLYRTLEPLRGTIIHNKHFTSSDGSINVSSSKRGIVGQPVQISANQLRSFALIMVTTLNYISGSWAFNEYREKRLRRDLDEIASLHGLQLLGQQQPFFTRVRVYQTSPDPLQADPSRIWADLAKRHIDQDCMFDLRVLVVRDRVVSEAYLFPWKILAGRGVNWGEGIDPGKYRDSIPSDIKPEHLDSNANSPRI